MQIDPRPFGQILGDAMNGLARNWKTLASPAFFAFIPVGIITLILFRTEGASAFLSIVFESPELLKSLSGEELIEFATPFLRVLALTVVAQVVAGIFVYLASHRIIATDMAGLNITGSQARRFALRRLPIGLLAGLLALLMIVVLIGLGLTIWAVPFGLVGTPNAASVLVAIVLFLALLGPGVWLSVALSMLTSIIAIEKQGLLGSLRRSMTLVRGRWWSTLGFLVLVGLLGFAATQLIQLVAIPLASIASVGPGVSIASLLGIVAQGLIVAAIGSMYTAWYIDLRARVESLTTESLV